MMPRRRQPEITPEVIQNILPTLIPFGNNQSSSKKIYTERVKYRSTLMPSDVLENSKNFWGGDRLYGKVDLEGFPLVARQSDLKQLRYSNGETFYALNFVADAWRDLAEKLRDLTNEGVIYENSPWAEPVVKRAHRDVIADYTAYMNNSVYDAFSYGYLPLLDRQYETITFTDYLSYFTDYYYRLMSQVGPLSLSGYIEGVRCSPNVSGLVIEISDAPHDDDENKYLTFVDGNFPLVSQLLSHYGFSYDINAPWRLIANIDNPAMREYMKGVPIEDVIYPPNVLDDCGDVIEGPDIIPTFRGFSQVPGLENTVRHALGYEPYRNLNIQGSGEVWWSRLFEVAYETGWRNDMNLITEYLINFYNTYADENPVVSVYANSHSPDCPSPITTVIKNRVPVVPSVIMASENYGPRWMLKNYLNIRATERQIDLNEDERRTIIREILNVYDLYPSSPEVRMQKAMDLLEGFLKQKAPQPLTIYTIGDMIEAVQ
tara:strand:+ start:257 stop:1720 length:1464 start_codon:yes stop_codon:yes gene_type:complete